MNTLKFLVNAKNADLMVTNSILLVQKNILFSWQLRLKDAFKRPFKSVKCANERRRESSRKPPRFLIEKRKTQASRFASRAKNIQQGRIFFTSYGFSSCMLLRTLTTWCILEAGVVHIRRTVKIFQLSDKLKELVTRTAKYFKKNFNSNNT